MRKLKVGTPQVEQWSPNGLACRDMRVGMHHSGEGFMVEDAHDTIVRGSSSPVAGRRVYFPRLAHTLQCRSAVKWEASDNTACHQWDNVSAGCWTTPENNIRSVKCGCFETW